ncbi:MULTISPECIES: hypothetical protein [Bradyrhizobium]|uniref:hypothetical protein n=1 Tax=Bradyrhizobium TaxID=374 RepID=UPI000D73D272|nr:hypothetical protein [Bradyrhizobium diazoefficiens]AWO91941.1 hypothetical protein DI395_27860 [Bradyrhizobium diazoefficiens]
MAVHIRSIRIPEGSCDATCYPLNQHTWEEDFPITDPNRIGIGYLVEPERFVWTAMPFSLHDHVYTEDHIPNDDRAVITYEFTASTAVKDVVVIQHANGVVEMEGFAGDSLDTGATWRSLGKAQSRLVGLATGPTVFPEFARDLFEFRPATTIAGKFFRFKITKTPHVNGWAMYRAYPRNADGDPFTPASASVMALSRA